MNPMIQYGIPTVAGLGTSIKASREDENIGTIGLAGAAGAAGGFGGLMAARQLAPQLAGRLAPFLSQAGASVAPSMKKYGIPSKKGTNQYQAKETSRPHGKTIGELGETLADKEGIESKVKNLLENQKAARALGIGTAAVTVPSAALAAGLGGVAAGQVPGAFGIPGFVDPESYGSSNSPGARYKQTTVNYV